MDLGIQRLSYFRKHLSRHIVGFYSCIYLFDIPLASGKTSMQCNYVDRILIKHKLPPSLLLKVALFNSLL